MLTSQEKIIAIVAAKYNVSKEVVYEIIQSEFRFIKKTIESLDIVNENIETIATYRSNFNLPYLMKLYLNLNKVKVIKKQIELSKNK